MEEKIIRKIMTGRKLGAVGMAITAMLTANAAVSSDTSSVARPRLVVGITVEGLSIDYIDMLRHCFADSGFNYILEHAVTLTDVDFGTQLDAVACNAIIHTGSAPTINGIPAEGYFDPATKRVVPTLNSSSPSAADENFSPVRLLSTTVGDEIKIDGAGMGHVHSIAPDASMAVTAAGHAANSAFWINDASGKWTTSTYYQDRPVFLQYRNRMTPVSAKLDTMTWAPAIDVDKYPHLPSLRKSYPFRVRFPYGETNRYRRYKSSPMVNTEITEVAIEFIRNLDLGKHEEPDMVNIAYTLQPFPYGNSDDEKMQTMDGYIRLDRNLEQLLKAITAGPGLENTLVFIAGTPISPFSRQDDEKWRIPSGEFSTKRAISLLNLYLINKFGNGEWITGYHNGYFYINPSTVSEHNADISNVRHEAASFLKRMAGIAYCYTIDEIAGRKVHDNAEAEARNIRFDAVGDIRVTVAPGWHIEDESGTDDNSLLAGRMGQPIAPAFILYPEFVQERIEEAVDARAIAPTIASVMKIRPPNGASIAPLRMPRKKNVESK